MCVRLAIAFALLTLAAPAGAEPAPAPPPPLRLESRWYGWQTLATDGAAIALLAGTALLSDGEPPGPLPTTGYVFGTLSYALGGPIVHFAHHNPGRGFASFGLRVPVPIIAIAISAGLACRGGGEYCGLIAVPFGGAAILTAIIVDAAVFGYDEVPVDDAGNQMFRFAPVVGLTPQSASLGVALTL